MTVCRRFLATILLSALSTFNLNTMADETQDDVLIVADRALELISEEDFSALANLMIADAVTVSTRFDDGHHQVQVQTASSHASRTESPDLVERGFDPKIMVDESVAMVWYPYDIYVEGEWSHCGVDIFSLVRTDLGWKIGSIVYSVQQPPLCQPHPDGKPN